MEKIQDRKLDYKFIVTDKNNQEIDLYAPENKEINDLLEEARRTAHAQTEKDLVWDALVLSYWLRQLLIQERSPINEKLKNKSLLFLRDSTIHLKELLNLDAYIDAWCERDTRKANEHHEFLKSLWEMKD